MIFNTTDIVIGGMLIVLGILIQRATRSPRIALLAVIVFLVGAYLVFIGFGFSIKGPPLGTNSTSMPTSSATTSR
jgi:hypothetical protein